MNEELLQQIVDINTVTLNRIEVLLVLNIFVTGLLLYKVVRGK